jgi:hypothetical protein
VAGPSERYFTLFRKAHSHYVATKVLPYLTLGGLVEIDESKVNHKKWQTQATKLTIRWMFGIFCRQTKLQVIYCIKDKSMVNIVAIMKKHVRNGSVILSDAYKSYCDLNTGTSKLTQFGFYHLWTNHTYRMVHEKFPFNNTLNVERGWQDIKKTCY